MTARYPQLALPVGRVEQVLAGARSWQTAAQELGIPAGLAFMIATGIPADASGVPDLPEPANAALRLSSPQWLVNPRTHNQLRHDRTDAWVARRAALELSRRSIRSDGPCGQTGGDD
jgi:hypothetical protein